MASTSALTLEDSRLAKFYRAVEESVFSVVYNVQKTRDDDLVRVNYLTGLSSILLDFIQVLPFLVHGIYF